MRDLNYKKFFLVTSLALLSVFGSTNAFAASCILNGTQTELGSGLTAPNIISGEAAAGGYTVPDLGAPFVVVDDSDFSLITTCQTNIAIANYMGSLGSVLYISMPACSGAIPNCTTSPIDGVCGSAAGVPTLVTPTTGLCAAGTETAVSLAGNIYSWSCDGLNGGTDTPCSAPQMVNGDCGPADGVQTAIAPAVGLCDAGTASAVLGGPWTWTCIGINTGSTQSCTAPLPPPPPTFGGACP